MIRTTFLYGAGLALAAFVLQWLDYQHTVRVFATELYVILIAAVAAVMYVVAWELYLALTDYVYIHEYSQSVIDARRAGDASDAQLETLMSEMEQRRDAGGHGVDVPLRKIVMNWHYDAFPDPESLVSVYFDEVGNGTRIRLLHERFESAETCTNHRDGWLACLGQLRKVLADC